MQNFTYNLYPELDVLEKRHIKVNDLHNVYYEICGNPNGRPVVFLHGGPGSGCNPAQRRFFDPDFYRIILIDQRGCGRSTPAGETRNNTTDDLVNDIELIRQELKVEKWLVFGGSWGSTLALAYAIRHTSHVAGLILRGIFLSRPSELSWFLGEVKAFYPEAWSMLCEPIPDTFIDNPLTYYKNLIFSDDQSVSIPAAIRWNNFEGRIMTLLPKPSAGDDEINGPVELARARIQIHYIENECFLSEWNLIEEAKIKLARTPTVIVQGRYDMVCPPITAWELAKAMPHAEFHMIPDAGHSAMESGTASALVEATEKFKILFPTL